MPEPLKQRWDDVGQRFEALGRTVKERYQSAEPAPGAEAADTSEERAALRPRRSLLQRRSWLTGQPLSCAIPPSRNRPRSWRDR
jgi:hypothetical protein